jgi:4-hydroxy-tetrahydrodipicolinate synthase
MTTPSPQPRFHGIVPPLATPLLDRDTLDEAGLERLVEHVLTGGVHGLFVLGTTGEGPALPMGVRRAVVASVVKQVGSRVPVLVGISDTVLADSLALARLAADAGAAAVVAAPPYYFPTGQEPLERWCRTLVAGLPLPLLLYNMPEMVKTILEPDTVRRLAHLPGIVGIKDSGGDLDTFAAYAGVVRDTRPDWSLLIGPEQMLPEAHARGGHGGVCGGANVAPRLFVDLQAALERGDATSAHALQRKVLALGRLYDVGTEPGRVIVGVKGALAALGICGDTSAAWFERLDDAGRARIASILADLGLGAAGT